MTFLLERSSITGCLVSHIWIPIPPIERNDMKDKHALWMIYGTLITYAVVVTTLGVVDIVKHHHHVTADQVFLFCLPFIALFWVFVTRVCERSWDERGVVTQ